MAGTVDGRSNGAASASAGVGAGAVADARTGTAARCLSDSHNVLGQRLGRKGHETRERILSSALRLLENEEESAITLTSVAREAAVGMTTLYLYFPDLGDLILAALVRVMADADAAFVDRLRCHWPDDALYEHSLAFTRAHYHFWRRHARLLYIRNRHADAGDDRFVQYRIGMTRPLIDQLERQMGAQPGTSRAVSAFAMVALTGLERTATVIVNPHPHIGVPPVGLGCEHPERTIEALIAAEARLLTLAVRHARAELAARPDDDRPQAEGNLP